MSDSPLAFITAPAAPTSANFLLWGPPKSGKSTAAATAPGPILWINAEGPGALGYARKTAATRGTDLHEVAIGKHPGASTDAAGVLDGVYRHVRDNLEPRPATVVVDTLAKVRDALVAQWVVPGSSNSLKQYGKVADKLGGFINAMRDLNINVVFIAHADVSDDAESGRVVRPLIGGKLTEIVPGEVDVVAYCSSMRTDGWHPLLREKVVQGRAGEAMRSGAGGMSTNAIQSALLGFNLVVVVLEITRAKLRR
jgi:hypothetical protein